MAYQTASKVLAAIARETTPGTAVATLTGAFQMRIINSQGLELKRAQIVSQEKRTDALGQMGRLGYKTVDGGYTKELSVGGETDLCLAAIARTTQTAAVGIAFASVTTVAISTNYLSTAAGSSWYTAGVKVGDIFTLAGTTVSGNHGINARVLSLTTNTITVATNTFVTLAASATGTLTILKKVTTPTTPTPYTHTIEQYDQDTDLSELFLGCMLVGVKLSFKPGAMATMETTWLGMDRTALTTGTSPYFTSPTLTTSTQLIADDSTIRFNGSQVATFNGLDITMQLTAKGEPVIGSLVTPAIFDNDLNITGSVTGLRSDFSGLTLFDAETEFEISVLLQEPTGSPKACLSFYFPRVKISAVQAPFGGGDGAKVETRQLWFGPKTSATGIDGGNFVFQSSGA